MLRFLICFLVVVSGTSPACAQPTSESLFLEAWELARDNFYDPAMHGVDWEGVRDELLPKARASASAAESSRVINTALDRLHASHTRHYHQGQREYYELLDIFHPDGVPADLSPRIPAGPVSYVGIGVVAQVIDGRTYAADVYPTGPADRAGLLVGDELLGVEDAPWGDIDPFLHREGAPTRLLVRRAEGAEPRTVMVTPERIRPRALFLAAMDASARVIEHEGKRIAYARVRSYAHPEYHERLVELCQERFKDADGLLLDLRGPWGGANPEYLNLFDPVVPTLSSRARDAAWQDVRFTWAKPVGLLIDRTVTSGKEILAHAFERHDLGPLIGEPTSGAVLGGRPFVLRDGSILYLAVADVRVDGRRLEGRPVRPSVELPAPFPVPLPFRQGRDPLIAAGVHEIARNAGVRPPRAQD